MLTLYNILKGYILQGMLIYGHFDTIFTGSGQF